MGCSFTKSRINSQLQRKKSQIEHNIDNVRTNLLNDQSINRDRLLNLTDLCLDEIQDKLYSDAITPSELLTAFQLKVLQIHESGNSGVCEFIHGAEELAHSLAPPSRQPEHRNTLRGIPISIKELCKVENQDSTFGIIKMSGQPAEEDCVVVEVLKKQGAIPYVLTATSQAAVTTDGFNPIFGNMTNPYSKDHEPGGSSNGEAVLISQRGSIIGVGTDLGGSIRIPSSFCGITGLKPTSNRISNKGVSLPGEVQSVSMSVAVGFMGHVEEDIAKAMRTVLVDEMFHLDSKVPPLPFNESMHQGVDKPTLKIGYYLTLDHGSVAQTVPSVKRVIQETVQLLEERGHTLISYTPPRINDALKLAFQAFAIDTRYNVPKLLAGEPRSQHTKLINLVSVIPCFVKTVIDRILKRIYGEPTALVRCCHGPTGTRSTLKLINDIRVYREEFSKSLNDAGPLDLLICPATVGPAFSKTLEPINSIPAAIYTMLFNMLDYPAGTVPISHVTKEDIEIAKSESHSAAQRGDKHTKVMCDEQLKSLGLPLSVQVVGKPWQEERVLRLMREIEQGMKQRPTQ